MQSKAKSASGGDEKNREIWIGKTRLYLGEDNILYVTPVGEIDEKTAQTIKEADLKFKKMSEKKYDILADLNKAGKPSVEARKVWKNMAEDEKTGKIALFGMGPVTKVIASFVMGITKKEDMRFFKTREKALAWLKE